MGLWITPFSNPRLVTKMYRLDYLQFFSQETLGAPRPQSHLHEFIDSWLVPWKRQRLSGKSSRVWSVLLRTTRFNSDLKELLSPQAHCSESQSLHNTCEGQEDGMMGTKAKAVPSAMLSRADFHRSTFLISQTPCRGRMQGKGKNAFSRLSDMRCHQATHQCQRSPCSPML